MKNLIIITLAALAISLTPAAAQQSTDVLSYWRTLDGIATQSTYRHILNIAKKDFHHRDSVIAGLGTREQWEAYISQNRRKLAQLVGTFPEKCPLNAETVGIAEQDGIVAEKVVFESLPGYKVPAVVLRPKKTSGRLPAVLYCCGHIPNGFRYEAYQKLMLNLVKKGFIVMTFDPIGQGERHMTKFEAATHEHSYAGAQAFALGFSPALYFINDGIRAIDYLQSRRDVDPARIGVTGRSGGGTQAAYIGACDERVAAVATENYITDLNHLLTSKGAQDAEQNFIHAIAEGFDNSDLLTLRAPRPTLIVATYNDIFAIQGTENAFGEASRAFKALESEDNLSITYDYGGHTSTPKNNQAIYAFFSKHLKNPCSTEDVAVKYFKEQELTLFPGKNFFEAIAGKTMFQTNRELGEAVKAERAGRQSGDYAEYLTNLPQTVWQVTGLSRHPWHKVKATFSGKLHCPTYDAEQYLINGCGNYSIPVLRLVPHIGANGHTILYLDDRGKHHAVTEGNAEALVNAGNTVVIPDLSGTGEMGTGYITGGDAEISGVSLNLWHASILVNHSLAAVRIQEIANVSKFALSKSAGESKIAAIATGAHCADLLQTATVRNRYSTLTLVDPLGSWQEIVGSSDYDVKHLPGISAGVLRYYDIPDLLNYMAAQGVTVNVTHTK